MALSTFTLLCSRPYHPSPHFHHPQLQACPHESLTPKPPSLQPLTTTLQPSVSTNLTTLGTSYKWSHTVLARVSGWVHLAQCLQSSPKP